ADTTGRVDVAAVQGDVPGNGTDVLAHYRQITDQHEKETGELAADVRAGRTAEPDFVVWPENSTAIDPFEDSQMDADIEAALDVIETHRYVVVAAINGTTGVIAPDGSVVASEPARTQAYVDSPVELFDTVMPAVRIGPWLGRACAGLVVLGWLLALGQYRRSR